MVLGTNLLVSQKRCYISLLIITNITVVVVVVDVVVFVIVVVIIAVGVTWQPSAEVQSMTVQTMSSQQPLGGPVAPSVASFEAVPKHPGTVKDRSDDVEVMSSDSSSSSSSDE